MDKPESSGYRVRAVDPAVQVEHLVWDVLQKFGIQDFYASDFLFSDFRMIVMNDMCKNNLSLSTNHLETTKRNIKSCKYYPFVSEQKKN